MSQAPNLSLRRTAIVTVQRGSWHWQDAYAVRVYRPHLTRSGVWVWWAHGWRVRKASRPQLHRAGYTGPVTALHRIPLTSAELAALAGCKIAADELVMA